MSVPEKTIMIAGNGPCAEQVAARLTAADAPLLVVTADDVFSVDSIPADGAGKPSLEVLKKAVIQRCRRIDDAFRVDIDSGCKHFARTVAAIVVAATERREGNFSLYGLRASKRVLRLADAARRKDVDADELSDRSGMGTIVFLTGLFSESDPVIAEEVMRAALRFQTASSPDGKTVQTYILTKNLKVAGDGLEALYRETRQAGTVYIKFTDTRPDIIQEDDEVRIIFTDEITGLPFRLTPDITVVDETILPPEPLDNLAAVMGLEQDAKGFAQADNVHRLPVFTNRNGIFIAGSSRSVQGLNDQTIDAANAALAMTAWLRAEDVKQTEGKARIDEGACVRCLTCYRLCPYHAVSLGVYPEVVPAACERCGLCAAECPQHAIEIQGLGRREMTNRIGARQKDPAGAPFDPFIVAFCCSRSGSRAAELASLTGQALPEGLKIVEVPCAGGLSTEHVLSGCLNGADGILVLTCHEENCHSTRGNLHARARVEHLKERLVQIGYDPKRLEIHALASNMGTEFAGLIQRFNQKLEALGPSPLNR